MAVTIVVLSGSASGAPELSLTLDAPRLVIGRGEGCEVRLPDASVSHRHASLRQRGGEYMLFDEGSRNGTFLGPVRLPPQTPRAVRSGERLRVGRVWLEVRIEHAIVKGNTTVAAKELALALVARGMAAQGIEGSPAEALAEIERSPDEPMADGEVPEPPSGDAEPEAEPEAAEAPSKDVTPTPAPTAALTPKPRAVAEAGGWGKVDSAVVLLAIGVMALSLLGAWWFLGR
jgi:predicted component of type VI protein secretion system